MFINAEPRHVSNGSFETFVHRPAVRRRLVEMTNNDANAWGGLRTVGDEANANWGDHLDVFGNENFSVQSPYGPYFTNTTTQSQTVDLSRSPYPVNQQAQYAYYKRAAPQAHQQPTPNMNCFNKPSPMLGHDYTTYNMQSRGSFAEFSGMQNVLKGFAYQQQQPMMETVMPTFSTMNSAAIMQTSYLDDGSGLNSSMNVNMNMNMNMEKISPSTAYSGRSTSSHSIDPRTLSQYGMSNSASSTNSWWPETSHASSNKPLNHDVPTTTHDGLPRYQISNQSQQFNNSWPMPSSTSDTWPTHAVTSNDLSSTALAVDISSSLSGSSQESVLQISDSSSCESSEDEQSNYSSPERLEVVEPQSRRPRQILPSSGSTPRRMLPILASNNTSSSRNARKRPSTGTNTSTSNVRRKDSLLPGGDSSYYPTASRSSVHKRIEPKPVAPSEQCVHTLVAVKAVQYRDAKDDFLVRSKMAGMSYKDIRKKGKFTEAESTLRGRYRTLTKHKTARVRKPEWNDNDIVLLKRAVRKLTRSMDLSKNKVPWKLVAEYISENGGSYHFGNATCRKRWDELQEES